MARPPALRSLEYWAYQYKRTWRGTLVSSVLSPVLYLAAMGVGLGSLVDKSGRAAHHLGGIHYLPFLAPGLLAAAAMQTAATESSWPVLGAIKWIRTYHAMLATPLRVWDVLTGHLAWMALRLTTTVTVFLCVIALFGATTSWTAVLTVPAGVLTGLAFAAPIAAFAATQESDYSFAALFRFGIVPMFLFSGTFFPVSQLPPALRPIAYATPLWHGVDLCRTLALGTATPGRTLLHVLYLAAWVGIGTRVALFTYERRLVN
jgi:lipooligosaccharide transport system permease protein